MGLKIYKTLPNQGLVIPPPPTPSHLSSRDFSLSLSLSAKKRIEIVLFLYETIRSMKVNDSWDRPHKLTKLYSANRA